MDYANHQDIDWLDLPSSDVNIGVVIVVSWIVLISEKELEQKTECNRKQGNILEFLYGSSHKKAVYKQRRSNKLP